MAIDDIQSRDTDDLVLPHRAFYPIPIQPAHWQLRHYINLPKSSHLYYATGSNVYCLNIETRKRTHIAALPFDARCTHAAHGWMCIGGAEDGQFAAIQLEPSTTGHDLAADVDTLLPVQLGAATDRAGSEQRPFLPRMTVTKLGEDIVNSVSIHKLDSDVGGFRQDTVAVTTNNDHTVRLFSLSSLTEIAVLHLTFQINHATISPDGHMLVAVGDYPQAFFYERVVPPADNETLSKARSSSSYEFGWCLIMIVPLHVPHPATSTGYFTTAWSASGRLCAVGSELGYITVFDTERICEAEYADEAIVKIAPSSRPNSHPGPGAVRTMLFAPEPWDLLIWSEDQGRVCISDIRTGFRTKQVINLDSKADGVEALETTEILSESPRIYEDEAHFIRQYRRALDADDTSAAVNYATEYIESSIERRNNHRHVAISDEVGDSLSYGLSREEREILEALRSGRQHEAGRDQGVAPRSIIYSNISAFNRTGGSASPAGFSSDFPSLRSTTELPRVGIFRDYTRERGNEEDGGRTIVHQPRRRNSIVFSDEGRAGPMPGTRSTLPRSTLYSPPPYTTRSDIYMQNDEAWRSIEDALQRDSNSTPETSAFRPPPPPDPPVDLTSELRRLRQTNRDRQQAARNQTTETENRSSPDRQALFRQAALLESARRDSASPAELEFTDERLRRLRNNIRARQEAWNAARDQSPPAITANGIITPAAPAAPSATDPSSDIRRLRHFVRARERAMRMREAGMLANGRDFEIGSLRGRRFTLDPQSQWGALTAGLAMTSDGRTLYAGTEEGIWVLNINVQARRFFPAMEPR